MKSKIYLLILCFSLVLIVSCDSWIKEDGDRIENSFQQTEDFELIKEYVIERENYGNKYSWDNDYTILRNLVLGDSLELSELKRQLFAKKLHDKRLAIINDSLNLISIDSLINSIEDGMVLRIITQASMIPFVTVYTIVKTKSNSYLKRKKCILSSDIFGESRAYSIIVDEELVKGSFIWIANDSISLTDQEFQKIYVELPPYRFLKSNFEFEGGKTLDGTNLYIEHYNKYDNKIFEKYVLENQKGELREFEKLVEEILWTN